MSELPKRKVGRPPKYDWLDKRDICYKLYVEEQRSPAEIIKYFTDHFNVDPDDIPSRKGFHRQFQSWGFPNRSRSQSEKLSEDEEASILARMKDLWEQNVNQKDIKATLAEEGSDLKHYVFNKLWRKAGLRLRNDSGYKAPDLGEKRKHSEDGFGSPGTQDVSDLDQHTVTPLTTSKDQTTLTTPLNDAQAALRAQRLLEIQFESDQKFQSRKRRRRIRGYGHLPPDAPGTAPRYASETSLDECKAYLHLSNEMYNTVRKDFAAICRELGIVKKTLCAEGVWEGSKQRLIRENLHLSAMMHPLQPDQDKKAVALDCLCADVTKRMRVKDRAITIAEANNLLGLNPTESKAARRSLYEILAANNFESKLVSGEDQWKSLRQRWYDSSEKLQNVVRENDPHRMKCLDLLCSDAMKRFREDKNKRGERSVVQKNANYGPGPGPAWAATAPRSKRSAVEKQTPNALQNIREPRVRAAVEGRGYPPQPSGGLIASLAQATGNIDFDIDPMLTASDPYPENVSQQIPAYFGLAPESRVVGSHPKLWLGRLTSATIDALHKAAVAKAGPARVTKVHGVLDHGNGSEDSWLIERDDELAAYLGEAGEKARFTVVLEGGYV